MTGQNTSHAVMNQRHEDGDALDDFPTPPWATRALCERLHSLGFCLDGRFVWEPACGRGFMARPLEEYFANVLATDVADYGGTLLHDFLTTEAFGSQQPAEVVITNPPFRLALPFIHRALDVVGSDGMVAMLCRTNFVESADRFQNLFRDRRPRFIWQFSERVPMVRGRCDEHASSATAYAWFVWSGRVSTFTTFDWFAPVQRKLLERPDDYNHPGGSSWITSQ